MHQLGPIEVHQFPCLDDNYAFLVRDRATGTVAVVDTPDGDRIVEEAQSLGWRIDVILNTHWHPDHIGGNRRIVEAFGAKVVGPDEDGKIAPLDRVVSGGETVMLGETLFEVIATPGHTLGHIAYYAKDAGAAFVGDTLFALGCGRLFEGTPDVMWNSLLRLRALPPATVIFCAHEYTAANARFALSVDGTNAALQEREEEITRLRAEGHPTVPTRLREELSTNPFLRADDEALAARLGLGDAAPHEVFGEIRRRKDQF
ncbi:MAG: hydroxyacylglutathione hydrolase [Parvularcula sp.]|jgi:hydroxyacylglutathione hydrolase|nr:hydroxyacylglutathione hydrolase [Parvularcula sp.]